MTATIDALGTGTTPMCRAGDTFRAIVHDRLRFVTPPRLLPPGAFTGFLGDLCVPDDLYWVSRMPAPIVGMSYPGRADWSRLHEAGIGHVVCLSHTAIPYDAAPCTARAYRLQDLVSGGPPRDAGAEERMVDEAAADVVEHITHGIGVAVHCMGGRGRTGTVLGVALGATRPRARHRRRLSAPRGSRSRAARLAGVHVASRHRARHDAQGMSTRSTAAMPAAEPWKAAAPNENTEPSAPRM